MTYLSKSERESSVSRASASELFTFTASELCKADAAGGGAEGAGAADEVWGDGTEDEVGAGGKSCSEPFTFTAGGKSSSHGALPPSQAMRTRVSMA